jgi:hypothetical protein
MWLYLAILIGIIGTILIERLHHLSENEAIRVAIQVDNDKSDRTYRNERM